MRVFLDIDGTVVEQRRRFYEGYRRMAGGDAVPEEEFWRRRTEGMGVAEILGVEKDAGFVTAFNRIIESRELLEGDALLCGTETLRDLAATHELVAVTAREDPDALAWQLRCLGIAEAFTTVLSSGPSRTGKEDLIRAHGFGPDDIIVGDTEQDILAGKALGLRTVAITCGMRTEAQLRQHRPDAIIASLDELPGAFEELTERRIA